MHVGSVLRGAIGAVILAAALAGAARAQGRNQFDGTWLVALQCDAARDGAAGYTFTFAASVKDGVLHGDHGVPGQAASLSLDGTIQPDGRALLFAHGLTGDPTYNVGRVAPVTPYSYHLQSRFEGGHGTGTRLELRPCSAVFTKQ